MYIQRRHVLVDSLGLPPHLARAVIYPTSLYRAFSYVCCMLRVVILMSSSFGSCLDDGMIVVPIVEQISRFACLSHKHSLPVPLLSPSQESLIIIIYMILKMIPMIFTFGKH